MGKKYVREYIDSKRLAYYDNAQVWWCEHDRIVCSNEEVLTDGTHEKCGNPVVRKYLKQWMLRIPLYAERLLNGLEQLNWPEGIKDMQRNWIGKSTGAEVDFEIERSGEKLRVYTTRPDTLFGATYMVIAPEHEILGRITTSAFSEAVKDYIHAASLKSDLDRTDLAKEKTGVFTGCNAINPVNGKKIPVWVADYVLIGYGTGAIMAVPAHDTRDFEFAEKFGLPIHCIMDPAVTDDQLRSRILAGKACWTEDGVYINSACEEKSLSINGMNKENGTRTIIAWLEMQGIGKPMVNYKLRDWLFSRQRYWGEPFPVIHWDDGEIEVLDDSELPLLLPELKKYQPGADGQSPLANSGEWLKVTKNGRKGLRETNTMPQWAGSCWYYLRFTDPKNKDAPFSVEKERYWMPVDLYIGGAEHAVLHLLYSRFWHKVLYDLGVVSTDEPFQKLFNQGMILAFAYETTAGAKVPADLVMEREGKYYHKKSGEELRQIVAKMSKSLKNVVNPDDVVKKYGADSLRLYEMFMGPLDVIKPWADNGVKGAFGFLTRVARFFGDPGNISSGEDDPEVMKELHYTIKKVGQDIEHLRFNTAISQMMIFSNLCIKKERVSRSTAEAFILVLSPFAPHLAEELWVKLGNPAGLSDREFPAADESFLKEDTYEYPVSFNGKLRFRLLLSLDLDSKTVEKAVMEDPQSRKWIEGKQIKKIIFVPGKIINVVVG
jgi:leucyl-tRNA synthetase